jgi:hypothetical protein
MRHIRVTLKEYLPLNQVGEYKMYGQRTLDVGLRAVEQVIKFGTVYHANRQLNPCSKTLSWYKRDECYKRVMCPRWRQQACRVLSSKRVSVLKA